MEPGVDWASFWGSAFGGGLMTAVSAVAVFVLTSQREKRAWARDLRLRTFSELIESMEGARAKLRELAAAVAAENWELSRDELPVIRFPDPENGTFQLVVDEHVHSAVRNWWEKTGVYTKMLAEAWAFGHQMAKGEPKMKEEMQRNWPRHQWHELEHASKEAEDARVRAVRAMQASLGLQGRGMLADGSVDLAGMRLESRDNYPWSTGAPPWRSERGPGDGG